MMRRLIGAVRNPNANVSPGVWDLNEMHKARLNNEYRLSPIQVSNHFYAVDVA